MTLMDAVEFTGGLLIISVGVLALAFAIAVGFVIAAQGRGEARKVERGEGRRR